MLSIIHGGEQTYWSVDSKASFTLLICLSFGLVVSFSILIHNIRKYYKGKMIVEMRWLSMWETMAKSLTAQHSTHFSRSPL